ncbi:MAG TPA: tyrosine-type recombinase/integrase [Pirellulales bacterium]|nr:tyrosine-type recombinase/integrase [Pirellulales bacterium]
MRIPKPFFRTQTQSYYLQFKGKQINLGRNKAAALAKYHELLAGHQEPTPEGTAAAVIDQFLEWCKANRAPRTYKFYKEHLQSFVDFIGKQIRVADLRPYHVTQWLSTVKGGDTFKYGAVGSVKRAFKHAVDEGYIPYSPVAKCKQPRPQPREVYITPEQWQTIIESMKPGPFQDAILFLRQTGCRPFELRQIEASNIDGKHIVFAAKKSKGKRYRRVIPLTAKAFEIVQRLAAEHPTGTIFRNQKGRPWTHPAMGHACRKFAKKLKVPLYPYAIRHTFCTDMLLAGMDPIKLAEVMGHRSLKMIMDVYSHLNLKRDELREQLEKFVNANDAKPPEKGHAA